MNTLLYNFSDLSKKSQLLAIGNYIKGWRKIYKETDITIDEARLLCSCDKLQLMYYSDGSISTSLFVYNNTAG